MAGLYVDPIVIGDALSVGRLCLTATYDEGCLARTCLRSPDICIPQHDTREIRISFVDGNGDPLDIRPASEITFAIARSNNATTKIITKTLSSGSFVFLNPETLRAFLTSAETGSIPTGSNYYECSVTNLSGARRTVLAGNLHIQNTVIGD